MIEPLIRKASKRARGMLAESRSRSAPADEHTLAQPPPTRSLKTLAEAAKGCKACPLWKLGTCTVFGEGPAKARIVLVGEQPGDQEDRLCRPFVGPAGMLLNRALEAAGVDRSQVYLTNAVKHFKWEPRGKRRMHHTPSARDIESCRPWLQSELEIIKPDLIVSLGATAAKSIFASPIKVTSERGNFLDSTYGKTLVTVHPSSLLRLPPDADRDIEFKKYVADLRKATNYL